MEAQFGDGCQPGASTADRILVGFSHIHPQSLSSLVAWLEQSHVNGCCTRSYRNNNKKKPQCVWERWTFSPSIVLVPNIGSPHFRECHPCCFWFPGDTVRLGHPRSFTAAASPQKVSVSDRDLAQTHHPACVLWRCGFLSKRGAFQGRVEDIPTG